MKHLLLLTLLIGCAPAAPTNGDDAADLDEISILSWNVESGGSDPGFIAGQLAALDGHDVYVLSEVSPRNFKIFAQALGPDFRSVAGTTGRADRLQILYNNERFELLRQKEMMRYRDYILNNGTHRSPLLVLLRDRQTGVEFFVLANHLARANEDLRRKQAIGLREWARDQSLSAITIGDFNMDYDFRTGKGNEAFGEMLRDNVWLWAKPDPLVDTNWSDSDGDGEDNYPHSMLDFAFVSGPAEDWSPECDVIVRPGDFPDDDRESDHRPIVLELEIDR